MPRRGENIHKRKDGRWEGRYKDGICADGMIKYRSVYGHTYSEVKAKLTTIIAGKASVVGNVYGEKRFCDVLKLWLNINRIRIKGSTEYKYNYLIEKHIIPELGGYKMKDMDSAIINQFLNLKLKDGLAASYVKTIAILIDSVIKYAEKKGICPPLKNPVFKPQVVKKEMQLLTYDAQRRFEELISIEPDKTKLAVFIALHTGMRIGEICALLWSDIDFESNIIHVRHTISRIIDENKGDNKTKLIVDNPKTAAGIRDIPISSVLRPILVNMRKEPVRGYVLSDTDKFVSTRTFDYRYRVMLKNLGITPINFHSLRHTFATRCIESGVDIKSLSEILGHADVSTTLSTYVHSSIESKRIQIEKLYENARK